MPNDYLSGFDFSSPEQTMDIPLNDSSMQENDDSKESQPFRIINDIERELLRTLSSLREEEGEQNDHYQEPSIVDSLVCASMKYPHCLVDSYFESKFDHTSKESN